MGNKVTLQAEICKVEIYHAYETKRQKIGQFIYQWESKLVTRNIYTFSWYKSSLECWKSKMIEHIIVKNNFSLKPQTNEFPGSAVIEWCSL